MNRFLRKTEDAVHAWLGGIDTALLRAIAIASVVYMLLAHGFAFTNLFPNHDSTVLVFDAQWTMYVLGRWAQNLYFPLVRGKIAAPWLIGAFSVMYLALAGYIIGRLLHLKHWAAALLTGILGTCASVTAQLATYTYETDAYLLAMLLACVAVWCTECLSNKVGGYAVRPAVSASVWLCTNPTFRLQLDCICCCFCKARFAAQDGTNGCGKACVRLHHWRWARYCILSR